VWYWDYIPSGGGHSKKPLTKAQIKKLEQAYAKAEIISESVKSLEEQEEESTKKEIEEGLNMVF
jgi:hypothetical protein